MSQENVEWARQGYSVVTSVPMIERHYGTLLDGAGAGIAARLEAFDAARQGSREGSGQ